MDKINSMIQMIKNYKYVSFDIFDTIIVRAVPNPLDVFDVVGDVIKNRLDCEFDFKRSRIDAEKKAIEKCSSEEITLDEIYQNFQKCDINTEKIKKIEVEVEKKLCFLNEEIKEILDYCKDTGKKIVIISDMYMPKKVIEEILYDNGVYYDYLYVSSEYGKRKSRGSLFDFALNDIEIEAKEVIHIGDNWKSDYLIPRCKGISSIRYTKNNGCRYFKNNGDASEKIIEGLLSNCNLKEYNRIGYQIFGPILYGFSKWIKKEVENAGAETILFMSRDGFVVKKAYEMLYGEDSCDYLYVSRRSLTVPLLHQAKSMDDVLRIVPYIKREEQVGDFLEKLGIDDSEIKEKIALQYGDIISRKDLRGTKGNRIFEELVSEIYIVSQKEMECARKYLEPFFSKKNVVVVDLGWYGTIQYSLKQLLESMGIATKIKGLYIGKLFRGSQQDLNNMKGYIYDCQGHNHSDADLIFGFNGLIEYFFSANHGSIKKYLADGKPEFERFEEKDWIILSEMQNGAITFVEDASLTLGKLGIDILPESAYKAAEKLFLSPTMSDVDRLGNIMFYDVYYEKIVTYSGIKYYLRNPKQMYRDFMISNWKIGFIKRMFKIFPPCIMYKLFMKLKG